ncbi:PREDICTED: methyltransferase-like protein 25 [Nicrophorus vespilloides]|uniref:Methyltransferase-like protein 25 n=1 Tax=Nicrophorus vespilloides TaxID=110193 RepID=A0ABM1N120_NICVS|nr:PREDICTED: methyltransferase-like protein 25 [Nicrophorus vespilloides]
MRGRAVEVIDRLIAFLDQHLSLSGGHMVDYFTESLYANRVSPQIRNEIKCAGFEVVIEDILNCRETAGATRLNDYVRTAKSLSLYNASSVCMNLADFREKLVSMSGEEISGLKLEVFMKEKKSHEVETLSAIAASVRKIAKTSHLVDIGDGKGYLSSLIAFQHGVPILGVDASLTNTTSAIRRAEKLGKHWHTIAKTPKGAVRIGELYKQVTQYVTERTDFDALVHDVFLQRTRGLGVIGLHTCGDLGPTSLRIFKTNDNVKSICNVSCCYHLLNENYIASGMQNLGQQQQQGFPMSQYLKNKKYSLGRATRMLAAQSIDRILAHQDLPSKTIFYRALLQLVLSKHCDPMPESHVGKFRKEPKDFTEYAREAMRRLQVSSDAITDEDLESFYKRNEESRTALNVYHLLRSMLAPAVESLILLDRYLFLLEEGIEDAFLVQLFDPVISPRCYGLIAFKK